MHVAEKKFFKYEFAHVWIVHTQLKRSYLNLDPPAKWLFSLS
jgi:hypothetical protein